MNKFQEANENGQYLDKTPESVSNEEIKKEARMKFWNVVGEKKPILILKTTNTLIDEIIDEALKTKDTQTESLVREVLEKLQLLVDVKTQGTGMVGYQLTGRYPTTGDHLLERELQTYYEVTVSIETIAKKHNIQPFGSPEDVPVGSITNKANTPLTNNDIKKELGDAIVNDKEAVRNAATLGAEEQNRLNKDTV